MLTADRWSDQFLEWSWPVVAIHRAVRYCPRSACLRARRRSV